MIEIQYLTSICCEISHISIKEVKYCNLFEVYANTWSWFCIFWYGRLLCFNFIDIQQMIIFIIFWNIWCLYVKLIHGEWNDIIETRILTTYVYKMKFNEVTAHFKCSLKWNKKEMS